MSFSSEMCIGVGVAWIGSYLFPGKHVYIWVYPREFHNIVDSSGGNA
jgi:hypothetical protein